MKHPETNNKKTRAVEKPSPLRSDSGTAVAMKEAREQSMDELAMAACESTGTHNEDVAYRIVCQVSNAQVWPKPTGEDNDLVKATALIREMAPQNAIEAMLAAQMIATHEAALMFFHRSTSEGQHTEVVDANVSRSTRFMRLFIQQLDALQKLRARQASKASMWNRSTFIREGRRSWDP